MIETTPSIIKNVMRRRVSVRTPLIGDRSITTPTAIARIADTSDHQNPGARRIMKVVMAPTIPLMRNSQPNKSSTASVAIGGITMAATPRMTRIIPSTRKSLQCSCSDVAIAVCICSTSGLFIDILAPVVVHLPCRQFK